MNLKTVGAVVVAAAVALASGSTYAQTTSAPTTKPKQTRQAVAKPKTRVVVTKRSYLDAGTEVKPTGTQYYNTVVYPPGYNPWRSNNIDPMNSFLSPPDPFWLPGSR
jgi:hypothetical protein